MRWQQTGKKGVTPYFPGEFEDVQAFAERLRALAKISGAKLQRQIQPLFLDDCNLDPSFEGWLLNLGYRHEVSLWNDRFQAPAVQEKRKND